MAEISLSPSAIIEQFKKNDVTHIVWLPDTETNFMYNQIISDEDIIHWVYRQLDDIRSVTAPTPATAA